MSSQSNWNITQEVEEQSSIWSRQDGSQQTATSSTWEALVYDGSNELSEAVIDRNNE